MTSQTNAGRSREGTHSGALHRASKVPRTFPHTSFVTRGADWTSQSEKIFHLDLVYFAFLMSTGLTFALGPLVEEVLSKKQYKNMSQQRPAQRSEVRNKCDAIMTARPGRGKFMAIFTSDSRILLACAQRADRERGTALFY